MDHILPISLFIGGTSDNGPTAKKFFSQKLRPHVLKLFPTATAKELAALDTIMSNYSVIGKVTNSSRKMSAQRIQKFDEYCKNAYVFRLRNIKYWPMNKSIHRLWSHSARKMRQLGYSLGIISENPLERMVRNI